MSLESAVLLARAMGKKLSPQVGNSSKYKHWISYDDSRRCKPCKDNHGKIWHLSEKVNPEPPIHDRCRCSIQIMQAITAGTATINGINGADWQLKYMGQLPNYYIEASDLMLFGWSFGDRPSEFVSEKMLFAGEYDNDDGHLPSKMNRIWYEADINYIRGKRKNQRIVWSNDGLVFVTYDHYRTFYEVV